jgi:hypothetical protein
MDKMTTARRRSLRVAVINTKPNSPTLPRLAHSTTPLFRECGVAGVPIDAICAEALTVTNTVFAVPPGKTEHVIPATNVLQLYVTAPLKPLIGVVVIVKVDELPTFTTPVPFGGLTDIAKSATAEVLAIIWVKTFEIAAPEVALPENSATIEYVPAARALVVNAAAPPVVVQPGIEPDRKSTRLNSSHP